MKSSPWVLGISASPHNGAVCLLRGDEIVVAIQEERLTRRKREGVYAAHPCRSLEYCFDYAGIRPRDLSMVVYSVPGHARSKQQDIKLNPILRVEENRIPAVRIPHHYSHAVGAFATSGFREAAILVVDGAGSPFEDLPPDERLACKWARERSVESVSLYAATDTFVTPLEKQMAPEDAWVKPRSVGMPEFNSLGGMYSAGAAQIFGDLLEAGKVMGLAPYGERALPSSDFYQLVDGGFVFKTRVPDLFPHDERWPMRTQEYKNLARSIQGALEDAIMYLAARLHEVYPSRNFCYAGGVALNSVTNERIIGESSFKGFYLMPAAEDSGAAIGAAYHGLWQLTKKNTRREMTQDAVGREYSSSIIADAISQTPGVRLRKSNDVIGDAARLLSEGRILGWFQGRSELGPRALGQRSILCDPRRADGKRTLNSRVKYREAFRPFAPVILLDEAENWLDSDGKGVESPFMLRICKFKDEKKHLVPAVVHVDGTGRVQTVTEAANGPLYKLVQRFNEQTGVPIILNTSFNVMGEPIVETPADALSSFVSTGIDYCVLEDYLVEKTHKIMFETDELPHCQRIRDAVVAAKQVTTDLAASGAGEGVRQTVENNPMLPLQSFLASYQSESMGFLSVSLTGGNLTVTMNTGVGGDNRWSSPLRYLYNNVFEVIEDPFKGYRIGFFPDPKPNIDWLAVIPGSSSAREVVFTRTPDPIGLNPEALARFTGKYEAGDKKMEISLHERGHLLVTVPGQVGIELWPRSDSEFCLRGFFGYSIQIKADETGQAVRAIVTEPGGVNLLTKTSSAAYRKKSTARRYKRVATDERRL